MKMFFRMCLTIRLAAPIIAAALGTGRASAQSVTIDPSNRFAWSENSGWLNFNGSAVQNVSINPTFLAGFVWAENIGWINLGDGTPANGTSYANANGADFGVNRNATTNALSGFAWSENAGWINFAGGVLATPSNPARIDIAGLRIRGYAWGENIGWINLDDATKFVGIVPCPCVADFDASGGTPDTTDIDAFFVSWLAGQPEADADCSGGTPDSSDITVFFEQWLAGGC
jgi:hypothetical protein